MPRQEQQLLAAAAENKRIAPFQAHDAGVRSRQIQQQPMYVVLPVQAAARNFPHVVELRARIDEGEYAGPHQPVADHGIGLLQQLHRAHREQFGIARTGADEVNRSIQLSLLCSRAAQNALREV